jgi:hypothetical protein
LTPSVVIPVSTKDRKRAEALRLILLDAVNLLDVKGAWPATCGPIEIRILNDGAPQSGDDEDTTQVNQMVTLNESVDEGLFFNRRIARKYPTVASILVSVELFSKGLAANLLRAGATEQEVVVHFLGHEIHHLTEIERLGAGGFKDKDRASRFASAFHDALPSDWKKTIALLIEEFSSSNLAARSPEIKAAEDIADEATADLLGLYWFSNTLPEWEAFAARLVVGRLTGDYAIADVLTSVISSKAPLAPPEIYTWCWRAAFEKALTSSDLPTAIRSALVSSLEAPKVGAAENNFPPFRLPRPGR